MKIDDAHVEKYNELSKELSGFDDGEEMIDFILSRVAEEIESSSPVKKEYDTSDELEQRLQDLGYME